jgi:hypothetical protein
MTVQEAYLITRDPESHAMKTRLEAHSVVCKYGMIGAGDGVKMVELMRAVGTICEALAHAYNGE